MSDTKKPITITELQREIARLKIQVSYWEARYTEAAAALGIKLPVLDLAYQDQKVRVFLLKGAPFVFAADVLAQLPRAPEARTRTNKKGPQITNRLRRLGLGQREVNGLNAADVAKEWATTERYVCAALGASTKTRWIGAVTPVGIETLRDRIPGFCSWVESKAFPAVIERFGKGGAS